MADNTLVSKEGLLTTSLSILADIANNPAEDSLLASDDENIPCGQMSTERRKNTNLQENGDQPLQRNRKTNNTERRNGDPREAKRLNVKKPNTNDQRKWRQVQKPRKTGPQKRHHDDFREKKEHIPFKKQRLTTEELENTIKDKIQKSKESIAKLKKHIGNNTCPKTLRYNARANIAPDEEFKRDIYKLD